MKKKDQVILIAMLVLFFTVFFLIYFNKKIKPLLITYAEHQIEKETTLLATSVVKDTFINRNYNYEEFVITTKNTSNEIIMVDFDTIKINEILNETTSILIEELKKMENESFLNNDEIYYIPFGIVTGLATSNWIGPRIPVKVMTTGSVETNVNTNLKSYGINNSLIEIFLTVNINTKILLPYTDKNVNIKRDISLIKKIIQGKVPQVYGGLYSSSSNIHTQTIE